MQSTTVKKKKRITHVFTRMGGQTGSTQFRAHCRESLVSQPGFVNAVLLSSCSLCILGRRTAIARGAALLLRVTLLCTQALTVIRRLLARNRGGGEGWNKARLPSQGKSCPSLLCSWPWALGRDWGRRMLAKWSNTDRGTMREKKWLQNFHFAYLKMRIFFSFFSYLKMRNSPTPLYTEKPNPAKHPVPPGIHSGQKNKNTCQYCWTLWPQKFCPMHIRNPC